jgi:hypothetical protein
MSCAKLTAIEIQYLTRILRLLPDADEIAYTTRVKTLLSSSLTPSRLKRPCHLSFLLSDRFRSPEEPPLCALHGRLNIYIIQSLFNRLAHEVGRNLGSLSLSRHLLNDQQRELVQRLRGLNALWLSPDNYVRTFLTPPPVVKKDLFQQNRCEACILARIGGDAEVLLDLRTILLSRTRTKESNAHRDEPALLMFVEAWLSGLKVGDEYGLLSKSWTDALALKAIRKQIWKERAKDRKKRSAVLEPELKPQSRTVTALRDLPNAEATTAARDDKSGAVGSDIENDRIDHYITSISRGSLPSLVASSRTTVVDNGSCGVSGMMTRIPSEDFSRPAQEWAKSYQDLLAPLLLLPPPPPPDQSAWDWESVSDEDRSRTRGTWWASICEFEYARLMLLRLNADILE